jgi:pimeloyl-ACP methyl ester carboxylesterase
MAEPTATIVLVHGAWADGSSWNRVVQLLQAKNYSVVAVQLPLTSVTEDLAATRHILADTEGPIVLVGHSWGGVAVTQAGDDPKVSALVYVSAFAPDVGETGSSLIAAHPTPPALSTIVTDSSGYVYQTMEGMLQNVAPDLPPAEAKSLAASQKRLAGSAFGQSVIAAAWKVKPCWFLMTPDDRVVSPELQAAQAKRMGARTSVLHASHMSLLSQPREVAKVIEDAAAVAVSDR